MVTPRVADIPVRQVVARRIARFLRFMRGRVVPAYMLVEYVYGDRPHGPPEYPLQSIYGIVWRLHREGYPVGNLRSRGAFIWDEERVFVRRRKAGKRKRKLPGGGALIG
jgi:hypothetical protein